MCEHRKGLLRGGPNQRNDEYQLQCRYMQLEGMSALATPQIEEVTPLQITPEAA